MGVREKCGLIDLTGFSKFEISGPGAEKFLDHLVANKLPQKIGRIALAHVLTKEGGILSELTITRLAKDKFYVISAAAAERHDFDILWRHAPMDGSVRIEDKTLDYGVLVLTGPKARDILKKVTDAPLDNKSFPWLSGQDITVGVAPVRALRVNFVGELGWELHHPIVYQNHIFDKLIEAGAEFGLRPYGIRAMDSLRLEKGYRYWRVDLTPDYTMWEAGFDRFVSLDKGDFIGRDGLIKQKEMGIPKNYALIEVAANDSDPWGNEPLFLNGKMVGRTTSGGFGYAVNKSLALAYVDAAHAKAGTKLEIEMLGERLPATIIPDSPWDPMNERLRAIEAIKA